MATETSCASTCSNSSASAGDAAVAATAASALMDATASPISSRVQELKDIRNLLWGVNIRTDIFRRWSQGLCASIDDMQINKRNLSESHFSFYAGFEFSDVEPTALVQWQGGPCAVIAPVQAFLLKILLMETPGHSFCDVRSAAHFCNVQINNISITYCVTAYT